MVECGRTCLLSIVDLRSDTVTRPSAEMMAAMASAPLGDDVLGDEPTVQELEVESAQIMGMDAALFVPSGTMANQIALACHCDRGDAVIMDEEAHILYYEVGAPGIIAGVVTRTVPSENGVMPPELVARALMTRSLHTPGTSLICVENTHNRSGGQVIPLATQEAYAQIAKQHGAKLHLDGARVFNAAAWLGVDVQEVVKPYDSVSFCLSKGLGSPVGSLLCGKSDFIEKARIWRKRLGGGMRQSGLLAACGLVSLRQERHRIGEDHKRARRLAEGLEGVPGTRVDLDHQCTNFVMVETERPASEWLNALKERGVLAMPPAPNRIRLVLHRDVDDAGVDQAIKAFGDVASAF